MLTSSVSCNLWNYSPDSLRAFLFLKMETFKLKSQKSSFYDGVEKLIYCTIIDHLVVVFDKWWALHGLCIVRRLHQQFRLWYFVKYGQNIVLRLCTKSEVVSLAVTVVGYVKQWLLLWLWLWLWLCLLSIECIVIWNKNCSPFCETRPEQKFREHIKEDSQDAQAKRILKRDTASFDDKDDEVHMKVLKVQIVLILTWST